MTRVDALETALRELIYWAKRFETEPQGVGLDAVERRLKLAREAAEKVAGSQSSDIQCPPSRRYEPSKEQRFMSPILAACHAAGLDEARTIEALWEQNKQLIYQVTQLQQEQIPCRLLSSAGEAMAAADAARAAEVARSRSQNDGSGGNGREAFLHDLAEVCRKHRLSLSHEDGHGSFLVERYDEKTIEWLLRARDDRAVECDVGELVAKIEASPVFTLKCGSCGHLVRDHGISGGCGDARNPHRCQCDAFGRWTEEAGGL